MTAIEKLEREVQKLCREELTAFREWDRQIETDVRSGKLDGLAQEAIAEHEAGRTKEI